MSLLRILLLSCSIGEGHDSAAKAVMEALECHGVTAELHDALALLSPKLAKFIGNWHVRLYRYAPKLFDAGYKMAEYITDEPDDPDFLYEALALGSEKLQRFLADGNYDAVICTHVFGGMLMTEVRKKFKLKVPCFLIATDYSCVPYTEQCEMNCYFIPSPDLAAEYAGSGLPKERFIPAGIPIRQAFYSKEDRSSARAALGLNPEGVVVLLMGGSMGCGPMRKIAKKIRERIPEGGTVVTFCGRNERLYESLEDLADDHFHVLGFTQAVSRYMDAADMIITKPGGLSSTEAANKHLPMVFIHTVGGCETYNFDFFLQKGYAVGSKNADEVLDLVSGLMRSPERLERMKRQLEADFTCNGADLIARHVIAAAEEYLGTN